MDREKALEKFLFDYELIYIKIIDIIPGELLLVQKRREEKQIFVMLQLIVENQLFILYTLQRSIFKEKWKKSFIYLMIGKNDY